MILHNVYFWLKEEVTTEQAKGFEQGIHDFLGNVPQVSAYKIGKPAGTPQRDVVDHSFAYSIFVWLENVADHDIYQDHPVHGVFVENFNSLWAKVQVLDSTLL